jgi:hypothetical protein
VAFGTYLDEVADDPWLASEPWAWPATPSSEPGSAIVLGGRGMVTFFIQEDAPS